MHILQLFPDPYLPTTHDYVTISFVAVLDLKSEIVINVKVKFLVPN